MSEKQDRQGARTEYQYNKRFAELMGIAMDARDKVDKVTSTLRNEMKEQYTTIYRDTEKIILSALENYTKTGDLETYKKTVESEFKVMADRITATVESTEESIKEVQDTLTNTYEEFRKETESEFQVLTDQITASVETSEEKIKEVRDSLTGQVNSFEQYKKTNDASLEVLSSGISANANAIEDRTTRINDLDDQVSSLETFKREATGKLDVLPGQISAAVSESEQRTNQTISGLDGKVADLEYFQSAASSELALLPGQFALNLEEATKQVTDAKKELGESISEVNTYAKSTLKNTVDNLSLGFESTKSTVEGIDGRVETLETHTEKYFDFSEHGLIIKAGESGVKLLIDNDIISFYKGEIDFDDPSKNRFGWWDGINFHTGNIYVAVDEVAQFGNFGFVPYEDADADGLDLVRVGD